MGEETLREYLIKIGYKVDEGSQRKFKRGVEGASKDIKNLGAEIAAATVATNQFIRQLAESFDRIYFISRRTGSSSSSIGAVSTAFQNLGSSAEEAVQALESLASFKRRNPGGESFLQSAFGVKPEHLGDSAKEIRDISDALRSMPLSLAYQFGETLGFSEKTILALRDPDFQNQIDKTSGLFKKLGVNQDEAAQKGHELNVAWQEFSNTLNVTWTNFFNGAEPALKWAVDLQKVFTEKLIPAMNTFGRWWTDTFEGVGAWWGAVESGTFKNGSRGERARATALMTGKSTLWDKKDYTNTLPPQSANDTLRFFEEKGWTREQAAGIVANLQAESRMDPKAVGDGGKARGVAQWHPDRQEEFKKFSGKDIGESSLAEQLAFVDYELRHGKEQRAGALLRGATTAEQAGAIVSQHYERPADMMGQATLRGQMAQQIASGATINQTTNITVNGASNAEATADAVSRAQNNVNTTLRNSVGAIQ
jgi:hypothetical protein